jgi:hypothetical protein
VVEKNDCFDNLKAVIGEPNCEWTVYKYYYYELEDGLFAVCKVESPIGSTRPRIDGRVARPNVVLAVYIADEKDHLETVWMAEDIIRIFGRYLHYTPIDRELTEECFLSFVAYSNCPKQLEEVIGLPNATESRIRYYILSDGRFLVCREYSTAGIVGLFIADANKRVHTVWETAIP